MEVGAQLRRDWVGEGDLNVSKIFDDRQRLRDLGVFLYWVYGRDNAEGEGEGCGGRELQSS